MKTIAFIGLDGSGKTTQSTRFVHRRTTEGVDAVYEHQFRFNSEGVMKAKARLRPILLRAQDLVCVDGTVIMAPKDSKLMEAVRQNPIWRFLSRLILIPPLVIAVLWLGWQRTRHKLSRNKDRALLVLDRYFYDELVRVEWKLGIRLPFRKLWLKLFPPPNLVFYFDIPGEVSWQRMDPQDSSRDAMRRKEEAYKHWLDLVGSHTRLHRIPVLGRSIEEVGAEVERLYATFLSESTVGVRK